jgi:alpha-D-ribose 1-methylphosphonate 5-triphosphate synthase subunit PhnL
LKHLEICDLTKTFNVHVLGGKQIQGFKNVNICVKRGEFLAIVGSSGSGKSSLLKSIYRTYIPDCGSILYHHDHNVTTDLMRASDHEILKLRKDKIGYVSQLLHVIPRVIAIDVIAEPLLQRGRSLDKARDTASGYLAQLKIPTNLWDAYPSTFSGGERQRVNIARALIAAPELLLLDEPTSALDPVSTNVVVDMLRQVNKKTTMIGIFHDLSIVRELSDRVIMMKDKQVIAIGTPEEIIGD